MSMCHSLLALPGPQTERRRPTEPEPQKPPPGLELPTERPERDTAPVASVEERSTPRPVVGGKATKREGEKGTKCVGMAGQLGWFEGGRKWPLGSNPAGLKS